MASAAVAPVVASRDVRLTPPATAMVWLGPGRPHEAIAVPGVRLADGDVLVELELATVCGSDVHTVSGHRKAPTPLVLGHEYVGRVVAVLDEVRGADGVAIGVGDRVVWSIMASCDRCDRCRRGLPQKCRELRKYGHERLVARWELSGGFATHVHLRAGTTIVRVGESIPAAVLAPAACATATAWAAVDRAGDIVDVDGATMLVTGAGLIGLTATAIASRAGARVIVADPDPARRTLARSFGAAAMIDPAEAGALGRALRRLRARELDIAIEASGAAAAVSSALDEIGVGGVVVLVGSVSPSPAYALDPERTVRNLTTVRGVHNYDPADLAGAVAFLEEHAHRYPFAQLVGRPHPLSELDDALERAAAGADVRVAIDPRL
ncbi:alcohol dehydrogenase catalytic domain-containing protein [Microbacterium sp. ProA8]|uniref:zinc-binding dehydrogenase n=1 Tax=Microbacterium chionoecetis TaxID=3153754 RepID=UPI003262D92A